MAVAGDPAAVLQEEAAWAREEAQGHLGLRDHRAAWVPLEEVPVPMRQFRRRHARHLPQAAPMVHTVVPSETVRMTGSVQVPTRNRLVLPPHPHRPFPAGLPHQREFATPTSVLH